MLEPAPAGVLLEAVQTPPAGAELVTAVAQRGQCVQSAARRCSGFDDSEGSALDEAD